MLYRTRTSFVCFHLSHEILTMLATRPCGLITLTANLDVLRIDAIVKEALVEIHGDRQLVD